jgi:hypothetical protein
MADAVINEEVFYYHGQTVDGYRFTVAGRFQCLMENPVDESNAEVDVLMLGIALCGKHDNFVKKLGRMKAEGRMKSKSIIGRTYFSLYQETRPLNWFMDQKTKVFIEAAQLNSALKRKSLMKKFNL